MSSTPIKFKDIPQNLAPAAPSAKSTGALEVVALRQHFYRDSFRTAIVAMPILAAALLLSMIVNVILFNRQPNDRYFAMDADGRLVPMRALSEPYITEAKLLSWVSERVTRAYRMDPQNYKAQVMEMAADFTSDGFNQYVESLKSSKTIDFLVQNLLVSSAIPTGAPVIRERNLTPSGVYYWRMQVPVLVEYRSATKSAQRKRVVEVVVVRRPTLESPSGIGISQFVATDL